MRISKCYACNKARTAMNKKSFRKEQAKQHLLRCDIHHTQYRNLINNSIVHDAITGETTENPSFFSYTEFCLKKYENYTQQNPTIKHPRKNKLQQYHQTQCCACQKTIFAKKQFGLCQLKNQLTHHHILCMEFNNKYLNELREGTFFETSLKDYAKAQAYDAVDLKNLNNN